MEIQRDQSVSKPSGVTANPLPARKMREVAPELAQRRSSSCQIASAFVPAGRGDLREV